MPVMQVSRELGAWSTFADVFCYMIAPPDTAQPDHARARDTIVGELLSRSVQGEAGDVQLSAAALRHILQQPMQWKHLLEGSGEAALRGGTAAGQMLLSLLNMHASGEDVSVSKARTIASEYFRGARSASGQKGAGSDRSLKEAWRRFRSVSHFWGAHCLAMHGVGRNPVDDDSLNLWLATACQLADMAIGTPVAERARRDSRVTVLDARSAWLLPLDVRATLPRADLRTSGLEVWERDALAGHDWTKNL